MLAETPPSKWDKRDDSNDEDENMKPIRNIFKMSRELVTKDDKKKTKAQLADLEGMEFDGTPAGKPTEIEGEQTETSVESDPGDLLSSTDSSQKKEKKV